jgi:hypothetical protein
MPIATEGPNVGGRIFDSLLQLKDAGLVAASAVAQVASANRILDLGTAKMRADLIIDASAVEVATGDELYTIIAEYSNSATFASGIAAGQVLYLGHATPMLGAATVNNVEGRYIVPINNVINNTIYRYMRLNTIVAGTIATGVNYVAFLTKLDTNPA